MKEKDSSCLLLHSFFEKRNENYTIYRRIQVSIADICAADGTVPHERAHTRLAPAFSVACMLYTPKNNLDQSKELFLSCPDICKLFRFDFLAVEKTRFEHFRSFVFPFPVIGSVPKNINL